MSYRTVKMAEAERIELPRPIKVITVFKTDKHASLANLQKNCAAIKSSQFYPASGGLCRMAFGIGRALRAEQSRPIGTPALRTSFVEMAPPHGSAP